MTVPRPHLLYVPRPRTRLRTLLWLPARVCRLVRQVQLILETPSLDVFSTVHGCFSIASSSSWRITRQMTSFSKWSFLQTLQGSLLPRCNSRSLVPPLVPLGKRRVNTIKLHARALFFQSPTSHDDHACRRVRNQVN